MVQILTNPLEKLSSTLIMKLKAKIAIALVAATTSVFGLGSGAIAGEGGAAGSAAFTIDGDGDVRGVAVAAAIGKNDASSYAFQEDGRNVADCFRFCWCYRCGQHTR